MKVTDPVCGISIEEKDAAGTTVYEGKNYFFRSSACKARFDKDPEVFLGGTATAVSQPRQRCSFHGSFLPPFGQKADG